MTTPRIGGDGAAVVARPEPAARAQLLLRATVTVAVLLAPVVLYLELVLVPGRRELLAVDLVHNYLRSAHDLVNGGSPYPPPGDERFTIGTAFAYPPLTVLAVIPLLLLPTLAVQLLATAVGIALVGVILWLLGVRDPRCYALALVWAPVVSAVQVANVTLWLTLGVALAWRWRESELRSGLAVGATLAVKLFCWPLLFWLALTRRLRGTLAAGAVAFVVVAASWAAIGFEGLAGYPDTLRELEDNFAPRSYTLYALGLDAGLSDGVARLLWLAGALAAVAVVVWFALRRDEKTAFMVAVVAALACSPIVWLHYFALLLVPVALASPTLSWIWAVPLLLWVGPGTGNGDAWQTLVVLGASALTLVLCVGSQSERPGGRPGLRQRMV